MRRKTRTTKFYLSKDITDDGLRTELEELFSTFENAKRTSVEEYRKAAEVISDLDIAKARTTKAMGQFLRRAGDAIPMVAVEPIWWIYRTKDGEIIMECAVTEREMRNAQRAQKAGLQREVSSSDANDMFERDDDDDDKEDGPGFDS